MWMNTVVSRSLFYAMICLHILLSDAWQTYFECSDYRRYNRETSFLAVDVKQFLLRDGIAASRTTSYNPAEIHSVNDIHVMA